MHTEEENNIKWATMIPLIGGSALGCEKATGVKPEYHLSYSPFSKNEAHLRKHWPNVHMMYLDEMNKRVELGNEEIDFVNSVCPCAGLSMLNVSKSGQSARGADAVQNDWMLKSAQFVLSFIKPKCLWGENAPGLFDNPGKDLVEKLRQIAENHSYSFSLVKTNSELHGLPQRRMRTFYFFWKSPTVPRLQWKETEAKPLAEYLKEIPSWATFQNEYVHEGKASERYRPYQYVLLREGLTHAEFYKKNGRGTVAKYLEKHGLIDDCILWLKQYYPRETFSISGNGKCRTHIDVLEHMKRKLNQGLGYWDDSLKFMGNAFTAVISKNIEYAVHPSEDRFFSVRELLHLMGMPHDFQIDKKQNINHVCQNVPVNTAKDWADEVVKFCQGKAEMTRYTFMKQDNVNKQIVETFPPQAHEERLALKRKAVQVKWEKKMIKSEVGFNVDALLKQEELSIKQEIDYNSDYSIGSGYMDSRYGVNDMKYEIDIKQELEDVKPMMNLDFSRYQSGNIIGGVHSFDKPISFFGTKPKVEPNVSLPILATTFKEEPSNAVIIKPYTSYKQVEVEPSNMSNVDPMVTLPTARDTVKVKEPLPTIVVEDDDEPETKPSKKFRCGICSLLFPTKEHLQTHWKSDCRLIDEPTPTYNCGNCGIRTQTVDEMKHHWRTVRCIGFPQNQARSFDQKPVSIIQKEKLMKSSVLSNINLLIENGTLTTSRRL